MLVCWKEAELTMQFMLMCLYVCIGLTLSNDDYGKIACLQEKCQCDRHIITSQKRLMCIMCLPTKQSQQ